MRRGEEPLLTGIAQQTELQNVGLEVRNEALGLSVGPLEAIFLYGGRAGESRRHIRDAMSMKTHLE